MSERTNRRGHFRLRYPPGAGPLLLIDGAAFRVVELSERGMQFANGTRTPIPDERVSGELEFDDGTAAPVAGTALRAAGGRTTVRLTRGVGLRRMLAEQRRILRTFPDFLRTSADGG